MKTLQEEQAPVDREIVVELIACAPPRWSTVELDATQDSTDDGGENCTIKIQSPDQHGDVAIASEALILAIRKLALIFKKHGHAWKRVSYVATRDTDGAWDFRADYLYP